MAEKLITAPVIEPITLTEAKAQGIIETTAYDTLVTTKLKAARLLVEKYLGRALIPQTWRLQLDEFPRCDDRIIRLNRAPLQSVESITYIDEAGDSQTLAEAAYIVDTVSEPPRIAEAYGYCWPTTQCRIAAVTIDYIAGYDVDVDASPQDLSEVPQDIKDGILLVFTDLYQNREMYTSGSYTFSSTVESLLWPHRVRGIHH